MPTEISGSTGVNKIQDGTVVNADINSSAAIAGTKLVMPTGSILQVIQSASNTYTHPSTSWADISSSSITITPLFTSSKILYMFNCGGFTDEVVRNSYIKLLRDSTTIREVDRWGFNRSTDHVPFPIHLQYLDSPNTTSAVTYKMQAKEQESGSWEINDSAITNGASTIVMEIAG